MIKVLIVALFFLLESGLISASERDCYERFSNSGRDDSHTYVLNVDDTLPDFGKNYLGKAIYLVKTLASDIGCAPKDINFSRSAEGSSRSACNLLSTSRENSRACYLESNLGYFFVHWDMTTHVHITFNRWD